MKVYLLANRIWRYDWIKYIKDMYPIYPKDVERRAFLKGLINSVKVRPDLIIYDTFYAKALLLHAFNGFNGDKIFRARGDFWKEYANNEIEKHLYHNIGYLHFSLSKRIVPVCKYLAEVISKKYPSKRKKVKVIYNQINIEKFKPREKKIFNQFKNKKIILSVFDPLLYYEKKIGGLLDFMPAYKEILKQHPDARFVIVGAPKLRNLIKNELRKNNLLSKALLVNNIENIEHAYNSCCVFNHLSYLDCLPTVVLEAQACEKAVVATKIGGIPETMKDKKTGYLINPGDRKDFIEKMDCLLDDKNLRNEIGKNGREFILKNFHPKKIAGEWIKLFKEMGLMS